MFYKYLDLYPIIASAKHILFMKIKSMGDINFHNFISNNEAEKLITDTIKIAIIGFQNIGKSSKFNELLNENRIIVNNIPKYA